MSFFGKLFLGIVIFFVLFLAFNFVMVMRTF